MFTSDLKIICMIDDNVLIKGITSDTATVSCGVPQGSVFGTILLIYLNDIYFILVLIMLLSNCLPMIQTYLLVHGQSIDEVSATANVCI